MLTVVHGIRHVNTANRSRINGRGQVDGQALSWSITGSDGDGKLMRLIETICRSLLWALEGWMESRPPNGASSWKKPGDWYKHTGSILAFCSPPRSHALLSWVMPRAPPPYLQHPTSLISSDVTWLRWSAPAAPWKAKQDAGDVGRSHQAGGDVSEKPDVLHPPKAPRSVPDVSW